ncbi:MAG: hypothetical protein LC630_00735 [Bacteroidales bacterium]|nr:hypothetical protein [Bacteroidales bacterium]
MFTPEAKRHYLLLLILSMVIIITVLGLNRILPDLFNPVSSVILAGAFSIIAFISLLIFFNGQRSDPEKSVFMTLITLGVKMLLSFVLALLFFVVFKNSQTGSVILFFILYLAFTVFVFLTIFNVLKRKSV